MAARVIPPGAARLKEAPKATAITKLIACLDALGMQPSIWRLGGGQLAVLGVRAELTLAIEARFDIGETPTGKVSAKFAGAKVHDPIGIVRNLEFDYSINKPEAKRRGMKPEDAKRRGDELNAAYNTGDQYRTKVAHFFTSSEMNEWLDEWLDLLKLDHKRQSAKKRATKTERNELALLTGGTWEA